jgi:metal-sulfur cluster biosynthetic enzyme
MLINAKILLFKMPTKEDVRNVLKGVTDPEIGLDIITLELVYEVSVSEEGKADIKMTFTTPMCPYGPMLLEEIKAKVSEINGIKGVNVEVVFDPPWQPSEQLRATLGV